MFISFEGIDGCGKSTQIHLLQDYFKTRGIQCHVFREPGGTTISEQVRKILLHGGDEMDPVTELLLFSAARSQLVSEKVKPILDQGNVVILDRFYDSTVAYQGYGRKSATVDEIIQLNQLASHHTVPDLTLYLRVPPHVAKKRTEGAEKDRMEKSGDDFFENVVRGFDDLSKREERFIAIDAAGTVQKTHSAVLSEIQKHF